MNGKAGNVDPEAATGGRGDAALDPSLVKVVEIAQLSLDPANVRTHPARNVAALIASLKRFGQQKPVIVDRDMVVRAGNGLVTAAMEMGWTHISAYMTGLNGPEATAFAIADNRTAELSEWDYEGLAQQVQALMDDGVNVEELGWADYELEPLLQAEWEPADVDADGLTPQGGGGSVSFSAEQREIVNRAIALVREQADDPGVPEGRCVELICGEYIGANREIPA